MIRTNYRFIAKGSHFKAAVIIGVCAFALHILSLTGIYGAFNSFFYIGNNSGIATTVVFLLYLFIFTIPLLIETVAMVWFYFSAQKNGGSTPLGVLYGVEITKTVYLSLLTMLSVFLFFFMISSGDYIPARSMILFIFGALLYFGIIAGFFMYRGKNLSALLSAREVFRRNAIYQKPSIFIAVVNLVTAIITIVFSVALYILAESVFTDVKNNSLHLFMHSTFVTFLVMSLSLRAVYKILLGSVLCKARAVFPDNIQIPDKVTDVSVLIDENKDVCIYCGKDIKTGEKCPCREKEEEKMTYCIYCGKEIIKGQVCSCRSEREYFSGEDDAKICIFCGRVIKANESCICAGALSNTKE